MVKFDYNEVMKRHDVKVPFSLAGESDTIIVASITEEDNIILHRELSIKLLRQIMLSWDEHNHVLEMKDKREAEEFNELLEDKPKNKKKG